MPVIDDLQFTQLTNLNILGELYEHGVPFGGAVTAPLTLSTANNPNERPLILRGGATLAEEDYDWINSGLIYSDGDNDETWRLWATQTNTTQAGSANLFLGFEAGKDLPTLDADPGVGKWNTGIGFSALSSLLQGDNNTAFGYRALASLLTANNNVGIGPNAGATITTGSGNIAIGDSALGLLTDGDDNIAIGINALADSDRGISNIAIGNAALKGNGGLSNTAVGHSALTVSLGDQNTAIGDDALAGLITGNNNTALGYEAGLEMGSTATAANNTFIGARAGSSMDNGSNNTILGAESGENINDVSNGNTFFGTSIATTLVTGSQNMILGNDIDVPNATTNNYFALGNILSGRFSTASDGSGSFIKHFAIADMPTVATGLPTGALWRDGADVKIVI